MVNNVEPPIKAYDIEPPMAGDNAPTVTVQNISLHDSLPSVLSPTSIFSWERNLKFPQPIAPSQDTQVGNAGTSAFARFTSGLGLQLQSMTLHWMIVQNIPLQQNKPLLNHLRRV